MSATAILAATRTIDAAAVLAMAVLGFSAGLTIVPQQHRLFAAVPKLAPVAVGLNGSGIYIATALGAAAGGTVPLLRPPAFCVISPVPGAPRG